MMRLVVGVFLISLPFLELFVLYKASAAIGFLPTVVLMVASATIGGMILAQQSAATFRQALEAAARGEPPHDAVLDSMFLMIAGTLLVIPGFVTDALALILLVPPLRRVIAHATIGGVIRARPSGEGPERQADGNRWRSPGDGAARDAGLGGSGPVIEGEFERLDERPRRGPGRPGST